MLKRGTKRVGSRSLVHYLIKWAGYPDSDNTWEPLSNLSVGAKMLVDAYNAKLRIERRK